MSKIAKKIKHYAHLCIIALSRLFLFKCKYAHLNIDPKKEKVVAIISCFNYVEYTKKAIESYYASLDDNEHDYILIIMDDHSTDGTREFFLSEGRKYDNICYFRYRKNMGLTQTWNDGVRFALKKLKADYIFLVNNDVILPKGALSKLSGGLKNNNNIGVIGPLTNTPGIQPLQDIRRFYENYVASDLLHDIQEVANDIRKNKAVEIDQVNGFFMGFPKEAFERNVYFTLFRPYYFNPAYRNLKNESEFQARLKLIGLKSFLDTSSFVFHYKDISQHRTEDPTDRLKRGQIFRIL
ncbi:glycosyltransferase family A protein [Candidatus Omnitrophota bacterium]